ncbi:MAG: hypothetical protein AAB546_02545 [Patescibacteria group bacterium]
MNEGLSPKEREQEFFRFCIREYLKYGSVDEVFKANSYNLPISYPAFHRLVKNWGIVKAAGPNQTLDEAIRFMDILAQEKIPLERLYRKLPPSFQTSMSTMHRILQHVKEGVVRRSGTALVITKEVDPNMILVAKDTNRRLRVDDREGNLSIPMGFSKPGEQMGDSILRVLQREVFASHAVNKTMPAGCHPADEPFMYLDIADVRVQVIHLTLPESIDNFSSFKLTDHAFVPVDEIISNSKSYRCGVSEIAKGYVTCLQGETLQEPVFSVSMLNQSLAMGWLQNFDLK